VPEYAFNARLAKLLMGRLYARGFTGAFIVSGAHGALSPAERAGAANRAGADLLISIHHDSVQPVYLSQWSYGGRKLLYCDRFRGYSLFISGLTENRGRALQFARILAEKMVSSGLSPSHYHAEPIPGEARDAVDAEKGIYRDDSLMLLKCALMPAVLMEAGVIVNRDEEATLETAAHREKIAEAVVSSVEEYCSASQKSRK
jgi:N-acetylmuramoyl-L-alanine amidase